MLSEFTSPTVRRVAGFVAELFSEADSSPPTSVWDSLVDENGVTFVPFTNRQGAVGFKILTPDACILERGADEGDCTTHPHEMVVSYILLNPSSDDTEGISNVFTYMGGPSPDLTSTDMVPVVHFEINKENK